MPLAFSYALRHKSLHSIKSSRIADHATDEQLDHRVRALPFNAPCAAVSAYTMLVTLSAMIVAFCCKYF